MKHLFLFIFVMISSVCWTQTDKENINANGFPINQPVKSVHSIIESISIDNKESVYDASENLYLQTIAESFINQEDLTEAVSIRYKNETEKFQLKIDDTILNEGESFTFKDFRNGRIYSIEITDNSGTVVAQSKLSFTFLPIAEITGSNFSRESYIHGRFRLTDANNTLPDTLMYARFRYRGHFAVGKQKKAYNVKITDSNGKSADASFFGFREDNDWILDAMAVDKARMRNRVSTDLWNDFSTPPYFFKDEPKAINGTRGRFVELFLNDRYEGIYCMTEKIDRKQLKLKKFKNEKTNILRGILYKADQWSYSLLMGHDPDKRLYPLKPTKAFDNKKEVWDGWELKYPDVEDGEPIDWAPLANAINVPASYADNTFSSKVGEFFDLPVFLDYYLFIELMLATDNHGKNLFLHCYNITENKMLSITPWDLDGTWGRRWDGSNNLTQNAYQDFVRFLWNYEHGENTLYKRLSELNVNQWNEKLVTRYAELRKTYFAKESLTNRFHQYHNLFKTSGADLREIKRWNGVDGIQLNLEDEMQYIDNWIANRLNALDTNYNYTPTGTESPTTITKDLIIRGDIGKIIVHTNRPITLLIHNISGHLVRKYQKSEGWCEISMEHSGMYIVNGQKVIVW